MKRYRTAQATYNQLVNKLGCKKEYCIREERIPGIPTVELVHPNKRLTPDTYLFSDDYVWVDKECFEKVQKGLERLGMKEKSSDDYTHDLVIDERGMARMVKIEE